MKDLLPFPPPVLPEEEDIPGLAQFHLQPVQGIVGGAADNPSVQTIAGFAAPADKGVILIGLEGRTAPEGTYGRERVDPLIIRNNIGIIEDKVFHCPGRKP